MLAYYYYIHECTHVCMHLGPMYIRIVDMDA